MILTTKNYFQYPAPHIKRYGNHPIVTLKMRKRILILMIQALVIQICWKALVPQYVIYGRKDNHISTLILH